MGEFKVTAADVRLQARGMQAGRGFAGVNGLVAEALKLQGDAADEAFIEQAQQWSSEPNLIKTDLRKTYDRVPLAGMLQGCAFN